MKTGGADEDLGVVDQVYFLFVQDEKKELYPFHSVLNLTKFLLRMLLGVLELVRGAQTLCYTIIPTVQRERQHR